MIKTTDPIKVHFHSSQGPFKDLLSPNDGSKLASIQYATREDLKVLLQQIPSAQKKVTELKAYQRSGILKKVANLIKENAGHLSLLISAEGGKPIKDARVEVARAADTLELCAEESTRLSGETLPMERTPAGVGHLALTIREPIGPVLAISAFNHPLNLLAHQVGAALASGNCVVIKPAPATPLCALELRNYFLQAGLDEDYLWVVNAEVPEIQFLLSSSHFAYVSFIGSAKVGWDLRAQIAPGTRLGLEHGGQAPGIVREDANLEQAATQLLKSSFYHSGQVCISTQRIFVHKSKFDQFLTIFHQETLKLVVGDAREEKTDCGPLIRPAEVKRLQEWIEEALLKGAKLICGNQLLGNNQQYLTPTVLSEVPRELKIMTEEAFGPVVCINAYEDEAELLDYLNSNPYAFEACLYTQDISKALSLAQKLSTMTIVINNHSAYRVDWMPFGGHGMSGLGMGGVKYAMEEMTKLKQIIVKI